MFSNIARLIDAPSAVLGIEEVARREAEDSNPQPLFYSLKLTNKA